MSQIKPYLFWIVSGVLLLVLLILGLFVLIPTDETIDASTPRDAYEVKDLLDTEYKDLQKLEARARRGDPNRVFDPQVEADIKTLTNDYLLTKEWKGVIDPHVEKYDQQLKALRQDLATLFERARALKPMPAAVTMPGSDAIPGRNPSDT